MSGCRNRQFSLVRSREIVGPLLHERAAALEEIAAAVGGLDAVAVDVRQGELADLPRHLGAFGGPVAEARPEPVRHGAGSAAPGIAALGDGLGVLKLPLAGQGERHDGIAPEADARRPAVDPDALRPAFCDVAARGGPDEKAQSETAAAVSP